MLQSSERAHANTVETVEVALRQSGERLPGS